jgi:hypothetical protein
MMRVLVACEFSGVVRDAFALRGHYAMSCDLLTSETPGLHYMGDVLEILNDGWDIMIAHPPCTHLAVSGARWFADKQAEQAEALAFVRLLLDAPIPRICLENPVSIISSRIRKPDQIIQPWQFGHGETKTTCLWLKNLPKLQPTAIVDPETYGCLCGHRFTRALGKYCCPGCEGTYGPAKLIYDNQTPTGQNRLGPGPNRWRERSRTYAGVADAMASQWSEVQ